MNNEYFDIIKLNIIIALIVINVRISYNPITNDLTMFKTSAFSTRYHLIVCRTVVD